MMTVVVVVVLMAMEIVVAAPSCSFCLVPLGRNETHQLSPLRNRLTHLRCVAQPGEC